MASEERWIEESRRALEASCEHLDAATRSRLTRARQGALEQVRGAAGRRWPAAAALASLALAVALGLGHWERTSPPAPAPGPALADLELLGDEAELELLADLEFYLWLEQELPDADAS